MDGYAIIWLVEDKETGQRSREASTSYYNLAAAGADIADWFDLDDGETRAISATVIRESDLRPFMYDTIR